MKHIHTGLIQNNLIPDEKMWQLKTETYVFALYETDQ